MEREEISQINSKDIGRKMVLIVIAQQKLILRQKFSLITGVGKGSFYLRTGKRLTKRLGEIVLTFKDVPVHLFESTIINPAPNQLILRIQPNEGATFKFEVKSPGSGMKSRPVEMEFSYDESFGEPSDEGYVRLLADAMLSDPTLFTRSDEVEAAWKLYTPLIELMDNSPWKLPIYNYESMTWGPPESDQLLSKDNIFWRRP